MPHGKWFLIRSKMTGYVLDVFEGNKSPGARVSVWEENGGENQLFCYHNATNTIRNKMNWFCLDAVDGGNKLVLNPFGHGVSRWKLDGDALREHNSNKCLDICEACRDQGANLIIYDHNGNENQQWEFSRMDSPFFYIKSKMCDRVLDVCGANCSPGAEVIMYTQNHGQPDNQLWYEHGDGGIRSKLNDYCLDSSERFICLKPYHGNQHQQWDIEGDHIANHHRNKVIDIVEGKDEDGAKLVAWDRHGGENQRFRIIEV